MQGEVKGGGLKGWRGCERGKGGIVEGSGLVEFMTPKLKNLNVCLLMFLYYPTIGLIIQLIMFNYT